MIFVLLFGLGFVCEDTERTGGVCFGDLVWFRSVATETERGKSGLYSSETQLVTKRGVGGWGDRNTHTDYATVG